MCQGNDKITVGGGEKVKIRSENYPKDYSRSTQCRWHVKVENNETSIAFFVRSFRGERNSKCDRYNDNLVIFDAENCETETLRNAKIWGSLCGVKRRGHYYTDLKHACFGFIGDADEQVGKGFELHLYAKK